MNLEKKNIAGMSMKGGRRDNFYFCLVEYFEDQGRWFLRSLLKVKDEEENIEGDEAIRAWITKFEVKQLILDFPLSQPACQTCNLECPGEKSCPEKTVIETRSRISEILKVDKKLREENPKRYEQERNQDDEIDFSRDILDKETTDHILSRSFKRRLKKGFIPYWNRPVDFWVWSNYYDQLLGLFNISYDSFGNTSLMILSRFSYLKRHFPNSLELFEGNVYLALIELLRGKVILKKDIINLYDMELGIEARLDIIKKIEAKLNIFIYDHDLEILVKNQRAFDSFLLAITGQCLYLDQARTLPLWALPEQTKLVVPSFN